MKKRFFASLLTLIMLLALLPTTAFAANNYKMVIKGTDATRGGKPAIKFEMQLTTPKALKPNDNTSAVISFDNTKLALLQSKSSNPAEIPVTSTDGLGGTNKQSGCIVAWTVTEEGETTIYTEGMFFAMTPENSTRSYCMIVAEHKDAIADAGALTDRTLATFYLRLKDGYTTADLDKNSVKFVTNTERTTVSTEDYIAKTMEDGNAVGYTASAGDTLDASITYTNSDKEVSVTLSSITLAAATPSATVPTGNTAAEIAFTAAPNTDATIPNDATYKLYKEAGCTTELKTTGITVSSNKVSISKTASTNTDLADGPNTVYLQAAAGSVKSNALALTITKAAPAAATVTLTPASFSASAKVPQVGTTDFYGLTADVKDQYGNTMTGETVDWELPTGITYGTKPGDATKSGILVSDGVGVADNQTIKAKAHSDNTKTATITLSVVKGDGKAIPSNVGKTDAAAIGGDGAITNTTVDMQYKLKSAADTEYAACSAGSTAVKAGTYVVRYAATAKYNAGATKDIVVTEPGKSPAPTGVSITAPKTAIKTGEETITLTANATGTGTLKYQWKKDGTNVGTDSNTYSAAAVGSYTVTVTNKVGSDAESDPVTSDPCVITEFVPGKTETPTVTIAPATLQITEGGNGKLTASVTPATGTITYKWYKDDVEISGQTTNELTVTEAGSYKVEVTRKDGDNTVSDAATATAAVTVKTKTAITVTKKAAQTNFKTGAVSSIKLTDIADVKIGDTAASAAVANKLSATIVAYEKVITPGTPAVEGVACDCSHKDDDPMPETGHDEGCAYVKAVAAVPETTTYNSVTTLAANKTYFIGYGIAALTDDADYTCAAAAVPTAPAAEADEANFVKVTTRSGGGGVGGGVSSKPKEEKPKSEPQFYVNGYEDGTFRPNIGLRRSEIAMLLAGLSKSFDKDSKYYCDYPDVTTDWYTDALGYCVKAGILNGYEDGSMRPNQTITRGEFAAVICRLLGINAETASWFNDVDGHWAAGYINALAKKEIVSGYEDETFRPDREITRAEAVTIINGVLGLDKEDTAEAEVIPQDMAPNHWAYDAVVTAMNTDITEKKI